jgi:hypothetical protein
VRAKAGGGRTRRNTPRPPAEVVAGLQGQRVRQGEARGVRVGRQLGGEPPPPGRAVVMAAAVPELLGTSPAG